MDTGTQHLDRRTGGSVCGVRWVGGRSGWIGVGGSVDN